MSLPWKRPALAAALALGLGAATGRALLDSMNDPDEAVLAALAENGAAEGSPAAVEGKRHRLVIAVLDGLGEEALLAGVRETNIGPRWWDFHATVDSGTPSLSKPVYHVLLTGVPQAVSGIGNNSYSGRARADDLAASVRSSGGTVGWALETVPWFHDLFGAPGDRLARMGQEPFLDGLAERALAEPSAGRDPYPAMTEVVFANPTLAVLHYTSIDAAGHGHGAASAAYRAATEKTLGWLIELRDAYAATPAGAETVWMIGADHGHLPGGGHGGPEMGVRRTAWIGLWPRHAERRVEVEGVVPAERLAATFAAILGVPAPREALGEALELPDREVAASGAVGARRGVVLEALARSREDGHRGMAARAAVLAMALLAMGIALVRRGRGAQLAAAAAPAVGACLGFVALGPGMTLSAIATHVGFVSRSVAAMALGAAIGHWVVRRWRAPWGWIVGAGAAWPAAAMAITAGSMGRSHVPDELLLVLPATGLVPAGVVLGTAVVWGIGRVIVRGGAPGEVAQSVQEGTGELRNS